MRERGDRIERIATIFEYLYGYKWSVNFQIVIHDLC